MTDSLQLELPRAHFDGSTYRPIHDYRRLTGQNRRIFVTMCDGRWRTLTEIADLTGDPEASISARLRDFRKEKFGNHQVRRRRRGEAKHGLWEYQLKVNR